MRSSADELFAGRLFQHILVRLEVERPFSQSSTLQTPWTCESLEYVAGGFGGVVSGLGRTPETIKIHAPRPDQPDLCYCYLSKENR